MPTITLFPDAVSVLRTYLLAELTARGRPVPIVSRVPDPRPVEFVRLLTAGGPRLSVVVEQARVIVEAWSDQETSAGSLARLVQGLLHEFHGGVSGGVALRVREESIPLDLPDPVSNQFRSTFTVLVTLRGAAA